MDGAVYEWQLQGCSRTKEHVLKHCNYSSLLVTPDSRTMIAVGSDKKLRVRKAHLVCDCCRLLIYHDLVRLSTTHKQAERLIQKRA
eukprot:scaffold2162_cov398-Prasinococcus_capsulatus_cf.AAC.9